MTEPLSKVDSAVEGVSPVEEKKKPRQSTVAAEGVYKLEDLGMYFTPSLHPQQIPGADSLVTVAEGKTIAIAKETQKTGWYDTSHPPPTQL